MGLPFWDKNEAGYEGPDYALQPWDTIYLNDEQWPGIVTAECRPVMKLDLKKKNGTDGGPLIERGYEHGKVLITVKIWTPAQWTILQERIASIWRKPGKPWPSETKSGNGKVTVKGVKVDHPALLLLNIVKIGIIDIESPRDAPEFGAKIIRINAVQDFDAQKDLTRRHKGAKFKVTDARTNIVKNQAGPAPSATEALPAAPTKPAQGSS
jgi:hypothetical protein